MTQDQYWNQLLKGLNWSSLSNEEDNSVSIELGREDIDTGNINSHMYNMYNR